MLEIISDKRAFTAKVFNKNHFLRTITPLTVKLLSKKFAFSEKHIMFVMKLEINVTSVILLFKT